MLQPIAAWSSPTSDLLLIVNPDGKGYIAQHTLSTDDELLVLQLPSERVSLLSRFSGPERQTFTKAHEQNPDEIAIWSGAAITRYRLSESPSGQRLADGTQVLHGMPNGTVLEVEDASSLTSSVTWVLPENAKVLAFDGQTAQSG